MKDNDLGFNCEQYGIELFRAHKVLKGIPAVHVDEDKQTKAERIVFDAAVGEHRLDGPGGFSVELKAMYYSSSGTVARRNLVRKSMIEAFYESPRTRPKVPCLSNFAFLMIDDAMTSQKAINDNSREASISIPLIAKQRVTGIAAAISA